MKDIRASVDVLIHEKYTAASFCDIVLIETTVLEVYDDFVFQEPATADILHSGLQRRCRKQ